jgi:hypothetical protein
VETALIVATVVLAIGLVAAFALQRQQNKSLTLKLAKMQAALTTQDTLTASKLDAITVEVEERLIDHKKYCAGVEEALKSLLTQEESKWRELIERLKAQFGTAIEEARKETGEKQAEIMADIQKELTKQVDNFRSLMNQAYLEQYEKMRRNPPRPVKRPRSKVAPPERYRSLDDDFNCMPTPEPEPEPAATEEAAEPVKKKRTTRKRAR